MSAIVIMANTHLFDFERVKKKKKKKKEASKTWQLVRVIYLGLYWVGHMRPLASCRNTQSTYQDLRHSSQFNNNRSTDKLIYGGKGQSDLLKILNFKLSNLKLKTVFLSDIFYD